MNHLNVVKMLFVSTCLIITQSNLSTPESSLPDKSQQETSTHFVRWLPDITVREQAKKVHWNQVRSIVLAGDRFSYVRNFVVVDPKIAGYFEDALSAADAPDFDDNQAAYNYMILERTDQISVYEEDKGKLNRTLNLLFDARSVYNSFGPKFRQAIDTLRNFEADRLIAVLTSGKHNPVQVQLGLSKWSDVRRTDRLLKAAIDGRENLFDYTDSQPCIHIPLHIKTRSGETYNFCLRVAIHDVFSSKPIKSPAWLVDIYKLSMG